MRMRAAGIEDATAKQKIKQPHLFDGLPDLGRFRAAAPFNPLRQRPCRRAARLAFPPRDKAHSRR